MSERPHLIDPGVFLFAVTLWFRQPLGLLLQQLQGVQQLVEGGLRQSPAGRGSLPVVLHAQRPVQDLLEQGDNNQAQTVSRSAVCFGTWGSDERSPGNTGSLCSWTKREKRL